MQYLNKNLRDALGDVFSLSTSSTRSVPCLREKKRERLSIILKSWNLGKKILIITTKCLDTVIQSIQDV